MISEFFFLPATWMLIAIVGVMLWSRATTKEAMTGLACYTLSYLLSNAFALVSGYGVGMETWQAGILLILLMYGVVLRGSGDEHLAKFHRTMPLVILGTGAFIIYYLVVAAVYLGHLIFGEPVLWTVLVHDSRRNPELFVLLLIAVSVYLIYRKVEFTDPVAKMIWAVLLIAEGWAAVEYASCKFVSQPDVSMLIQGWGVTVDKYSCGRAFGPVAPYVAPTLTTLMLIWIGARWRRRPQ